MIDISLILAFRERVWLLDKMFSTLENMTNDLKRIEILMVIDDDEPNIKGLSDLLNKTPLNIKVVMAERSIHFTKDYINPLATLAQGRWLIVINDDSEFLTKDWDTIVLNKMNTAANNIGDDILLGMVDDEIKNNNFTSFPILSKEMEKCLGYIMDEKCYMWGSDHILANLFHYLDGSKRMIRIPEVTIGHNSLHTERRDFSENFKRFQYIHDNYPTKITSVHLRQEASKIKEYLK